MTDANLGKLDKTDSLTFLIKDAKKLHEQLAKSPTGVAAQGGAAQESSGKKKLQVLSLERKRIIAEFQKLIKK